eukprot:2900939-Ditylum_brightwellii.AAC.1
MGEEIFDRLKYTGSYQYDCLAIFEGKQTHHQAILWLQQFQLCINEVVVGYFLQFTAELWDHLEDKDKPNLMEEEGKMDEVNMSADDLEMWVDKVMVVSKKTFPYLDMQLFWASSDLGFSVYNKDNQRIKYVNRESCH